MTIPVEMSVVVPTYNRSSSLLECLASIERQSLAGTRFEVIVVDDGSDDGTKESVERFRVTSSLALRYFFQPNSGPGAARNLGVENARGAIIAFTEDDVVVDERWLELALSHFLQPEVSGVEGATLLKNSGEAVRVFEGGSHLSFIPCNLFLRKHVFQSVGAYDTEYFDPTTNLYFREDADLGFRLLEHGAVIVRDDHVIVHHPKLYNSPSDYLRHVRRFYFDPLLYRKHPKSFRKYLEVKNLGPITIRRPYHYLSLFYVFFFLLILLSVTSGSGIPLVPCVIFWLAIFISLGYRYHRSWVPPFRQPGAILVLLMLPVHYLTWYIRGCRRFKSWGSMM